MRSSLLLVVGLMCVPMLISDPAHAQATRTWVSGVGDDANPCSRTAPCKTFAGAISKTATGGEINCLDPGGFGAVTIGKSISIQCEYTEGGVLNALTNGIIVNTPAGSNVYLSGLDINGAGSGGINGIRFIQAGALHVRKSTIRNQSNNGIDFVPTGVGELFVTDTYIAETGLSGAATTAGISVIPTGTGSAKVMVENTQMNNNVNGLRASGVGSTGGIRVTMHNSTAAGNSTNGITATSPGGATIGMYVERSTSVSNLNGVVSDGNQAFINLNGNGIANNTGAGLATSNSGTIASFTTPNNAVIANAPDGSPTNNALVFK